MKTAAKCIFGIGAVFFGLLAGLGNGIFGIPNILWWIPTFFSALTFLWTITDSLEGAIICGILAGGTGVVAPFMTTMNLPWFNSFQTFVVNLLTKISS